MNVDLNRKPAYALAIFCACAALSAPLEAQSTELAALPPAPSFVKLAASPVSNHADLQIVAAQPGAMPLSLDQAVALGLQDNLNIALTTAQQRFVRGELLSVENVLLPNVSLTAYSKAQEVNLAAMGFKPGSIKIPGAPANFPEIVKVNTTDAQLNLSQTLFNVPAFFLFRAAEKAVEASARSSGSARGAVVQAVGTAYLRVLADSAQVRNAQALVQQDQVVFDHARQSQEAGVGIHLDTLRAQVQLQQQQQALIQARATLAKDTIALNRQMGLPADQQLQLTDPIPYADLTALSLPDALALAYTSRNDLLNLEAQLAVADQTRRAVRYERLPTLAFGGYYGIIGITDGSYHGNFVAKGSLSFPIFQEGSLRGQKQVAEAQLTALQQQITSLKLSIEQQIRSSQLDVQSSAELVKVAASNVELATEALSDATTRYTSGVDDSLPVVRAQATLAGAQAQLVQTQFQLNVAKLQLARNTGVVETQYKAYLGR